MLTEVGRREIDEQLVANHRERIKERNQILEKNKKLRTLKKKEDFVPVVDSLMNLNESRHFFS